MNVSSSNARSGWPAAISSWSTTCSPRPRWQPRHVFARTARSFVSIMPCADALRMRLRARMRTEPLLRRSVARLARHAVGQRLLGRARPRDKRRSACRAWHPRCLQDLAPSACRAAPAALCRRAHACPPLPTWRTRCRECGSPPRPAAWCAPWQFETAHPPAPIYVCAARRAPAAAQQNDQSFSHIIASSSTPQSTRPPARAATPIAIYIPQLFDFGGSGRRARRRAASRTLQQRSRPADSPTCRPDSSGSAARRRFRQQAERRRRGRRRRGLAAAAATRRARRAGRFEHARLLAVDRGRGGGAASIMRVFSGADAAGAGAPMRQRHAAKRQRAASIPRHSAIVSPDLSPARDSTGTRALPARRAQAPRASAAPRTRSR